MTVDEDHNIFRVTSVIYICRIKLVLQKHAMTLRLFSFKDACDCECTRRFSQQYANYCKHYIFSIVAYQVPRNIVLAHQSVMS